MPLEALLALLSHISSGLSPRWLGLG